MANALSIVAALVAATAVAVVAAGPVTPPGWVQHSAAAVQARAEPFDGTGHQLNPGWLQVIYERNSYNYTLLDTFDLNCIYGDSRMPMVYYASKVAQHVSKELANSDNYVPVWCKYFDSVEATKATKPENPNQFIVTFGLFPRVTSTPATYDGYDMTVPFLTSRLAFAVPRTSSVPPARDTLSYSKAKQLILNNVNEYEWMFLQDGPLDKNLKSDLFGMLPRPELVTLYKNAKRTSLSDFYSKVTRYEPGKANSKPPVMIGELPSLRYFQQYNNYCDKLKIIETFIEANTYSLGVRFPPIATDKDLYDAFRTAVDQAVLKTTVSGELELLTQQILNSESTCLEEKKVVTVATLDMPPFVERQQDGSYTGLCIDILNQVENDTGIQFDYRPVHASTSTKWSNKKYSTRSRSSSRSNNMQMTTTNPWNKIIDKVYRGEAHMGVAPLTITPERASVVDFSTPFMSTELGAILPANFTDVHTLTDIVEHHFRIVVARNSPTYELLMTNEAPALRMLGERIAFTPPTVADAIELLGVEPYVVVVDDYVSLKRNLMIMGQQDQPTPLRLAGEDGARTRSRSRAHSSRSSIGNTLVNMAHGIVNAEQREAEASDNDVDDDDTMSNAGDEQQEPSMMMATAYGGASGSGSSIPQTKVIRFGTYSSSSHYAFVFPKISGKKYANEKFIDRLRVTVSNKIDEMLRNGQIAELTERYFGNM